jgi:beta-mannanase
VTRTPVSTKRTNRVASKNQSSGRDKKIFLSDLISRVLRGKHTEKSDQNSEKNFSVLAGLRHFRAISLWKKQGLFRPWWFWWGLKRLGNGPIFVIFYKSIWERSYESVKAHCILKIKFMEIFKIKNQFPSSAIVKTPFF